MHIANLLSQAEFSDAGPNKKVLYDSPELTGILVALKGGQEIPAHSAPYEVVMYVVSGEGFFHKGDQTPAVKPGSLTVFGSDEPHGIKAKSDMVVLIAKVPSGFKGGMPEVIDVKSTARCADGPFAPTIAYISPGLKLPVICIMPGQEIPPHPGATGMFYVLEGKGVFTEGDEKVEISAGSLVIVPKGGIRGIKPSEKLILFAAHAGGAH